jgi:uroporphyrinogen decarboxylase
LRGKVSDFATFARSPRGSVLAPIYETIKLVKNELPRETAFLGFCGAPWTVVSIQPDGLGH